MFEIFNMGIGLMLVEARNVERQRTDEPVYEMVGLWRKMVQVWWLNNGDNILYGEM